MDTRTPPRRRTEGRLPDFFVVGHPKCGTTAVYEALKAHPDTFMPSVKEPHYFAIDRSGEARGEAPAGHMNRQRYLGLFAAAGEDQLVGEGSVFNLWSPVAAATIAAAQPEARIIAILREPAAFLRSLYLQFAQSGVETAPTFAAALAREAERRRAPKFPSLVYGEYVAYVEQLRRYRDAFPADHILVLLFDDLRRDGDAVMRRIAEFLQLDPGGLSSVPRVNPTVRVRAPWLNRRTQALRRGRGGLLDAARAGTRAAAPRGTRRRELIAAGLNGLLYGRPREADEELMHSLRQRFAPEVLALSEHLDRDLVAEWGYAELL